MICCGDIWYTWFYPPLNLLGIETSPSICTQSIMQRWPHDRCLVILYLFSTAVWLLISPQVLTSWLWVWALCQASCWAACGGLLKKKKKKGSQTSKVSLPGLKSSCCQGWFLLEALAEKLSLPFPTYLGLVAPFLNLQSPQHSNFKFLPDSDSLVFLFHLRGLW